MTIDQRLTVLGVAAFSAGAGASVAGLAVVLWGLGGTLNVQALIIGVVLAAVCRYAVEASESLQRDAEAEAGSVVDDLVIVDDDEFATVWMRLDERLHTVASRLNTLRDWSPADWHAGSANAERRARALQDEIEVIRRTAWRAPDGSVTLVMDPGYIEEVLAGG